MKSVALSSAIILCTLCHDVLLIHVHQLDFFNMNRNNIIIGDFNSHNHLWGYRDDDENGLFLEEWISTNNLHLAHDSKPPYTFNSGRWKRGFNPDLACVSQNIRDICQRRVYDLIPRSQHRPHGVAINPTITPSE